MITGRHCTVNQEEDDKTGIDHAACPLPFRVMDLTLTHIIERNVSEIRPSDAPERKENEQGAPKGPDHGVHDCQAASRQACPRPYDVQFFSCSLSEKKRKKKRSDCANLECQMPE